MANKRGAGAQPMSMVDSASKQSTPRKGARSGGETKPQRTTRSTKDSAATPETSSAGKGTSGRGAAKGGGDGATRRAGAGGGAGGASRGTRTGGRKGSPDLKKDLRDFAGARPDGWSHEDWLQFLDDLKSRGHNINDRDAIGSMLERERLALALERIPGVGPQRVKNIADKYGYLWRLRETDADQLSREANVPRGVAEKVLNGLRH
jgi:hypothetical protein